MAADIHAIGKRPHRGRGKAGEQGHARRIWQEHAHQDIHAPTADMPSTGRPGSSGIAVSTSEIAKAISTP